MSNEKQKHLELKKQAIILLKSKGFSDREIKTEFKWDRFIIDVVGINEQDKIFIECGTIPRGKFESLKYNSEVEFIHLPYVTDSIIEESKIKKVIKNGIISAKTKITTIGSSKFLLIPQALFNDSIFPFKERQTLNIEIVDNKIIIN